MKGRSVAGSRSVTYRQHKKGEPDTMPFEELWDYLARRFFPIERDGKEYVYPVEVETMTFDAKYKMVWRPIEYLVRGAYIGPMVKITTKQGIGLVTPYHSIYSMTPDGVKPVSAGKLAVIEDVVAYSLNMNLHDERFCVKHSIDVYSIPVQSLERVNYDGYVYDICMCGGFNRFFDGESGIAYHNSENAETEEVPACD